jgi:hypothetical protein
MHYTALRCTVHKSKHETLLGSSTPPLTKMKRFTYDNPNLFTLHLFIY